MERLINNLTDSRLKWVAAKRLAVAAKRHYDITRAEVYLSYPKDGHYAATAKATVDDDVIRARVELETAEMDAAECWVEVGNAMAQLKQFTTLDNPMILDLE